MLIGGVAARIRGARILTEDVDVTPASDEANLARLLVMVAALADVIRLKEASGRPKDLVSVPLLRGTLEENRRQEKP